MANRGERSLAAGCLGCAGASALVGVALLVVLGALSTQVSSCSFEIGPGDGTRSAHLPVTVTPRTGLTAGHALRVTSTAFLPHSVVGVAVCLRKADTERAGLDACDTTSGSRFAVDGDGRLDARFRMPRTITVGEHTYDCAGRERRCLVVAADADSFDRSGGQTVSFRTGLPAVSLDPSPPRAVTNHLPVVGSPAGAVPPGGRVTVLATGFEPGEPVTVAWCSDDLANASSATEACEITDPVSLNALVHHRLDAVPLHADADGVVTVEAEARASIAPFGSDLAAFARSVDPETPLGSEATSTAAVVDCRERSRRCSIVVAAVADTQRSAVLPYELAPG